MEHKNIGLVIANGLLDIADALSHADFARTLYPTLSIKQKFSTLYAHVIRFYLRALEWYEEGSWKRAIHSVTKPAPLRYSDIINDIHRTTNQIGALAVAGSQAEQRDMHRQLVMAREIIEGNHKSNTMEQEKLQQKLQDVYNLLSSMRAEQEKISRCVVGIQWTQALHVIAAQCLIDHQACLQTSINLRNQRRLTREMKSAPFWKSPQLQSWNQSSVSTILPIKVPFTDRKLAQDFSVNMIEQLLNAHIATFWVLTSKVNAQPIIATLKSLIYQAVTSVGESGKECVLQQLDQFNHARLEDDFINVLAGLLRTFSTVYITIQLEAIESLYAAQFLSCLQKLIERLSSYGAATVVRTLVLSWSPRSILTNPGQIQHLKLHLRGRSRRRGVQMSSRPLYI